MAARRSVPVRSYRETVDVVERRIFRVDRWRIPSPGGISAAAIGYAISVLVLILVLSQLPVLGQLLGAVQPALRLIAIPALVAWALVSWQVDGRRPHHALVAVIRHQLSARTLSGLRRGVAVGTEIAPVEAITIAPSGDEARYRPGRVKGPATITISYPARLVLEGRGAQGRGLPAEGRVEASRIRVTALAPGVSPLIEAQAIQIPAAGEVVFE